MSSSYCPHCGAPEPGAPSLDHLPNVLVPAYISASPFERIVLTAIHAGGPKGRTLEQLGFDLWGNDPNGGPDNPGRVVYVLLHRLRKHLKSAGLTIRQDSKRSGRYYIVPGVDGHGVCLPSERVC